MNSKASEHYKCHLHRKPDREIDRIQQTCIYVFCRPRKRIWQSYMKRYVETVTNIINRKMIVELIHNINEVNETKLIRLRGETKYIDMKVGNTGQGDSLS